MFARWRAAGLVLPTILTLLVLPALIGLGTWQVQRKAWKESLIEKVTARKDAEPVSYAEALTRAENDLVDAEYLRLKVSGTFDYMQERHVYAPRPGAPGWLIFTPLHPDGGAPAVFVNRGWAPDDLKDASARQAGLIEGPVTVTGLLRAPEQKGWFTPESNLVENRWYARDLQGMLESLPNGAAEPDARQTFAPFFIDAGAEPANPGGWPRGGTTEIRINNPHLQYVVTWYGLALTLIVIFAVFARQRLRALDDKAD